MYYKWGQACVTNWGSFVLLQISATVITKQGSYYKLGQNVLQIRGRYYKLGQLLQIGA